MASTSASSVQKSFKYDVYLSFMGEDTRKSFVDHLYGALDNRGIRTFKDDTAIEKGERISDAVIRALEDSRFFIIVFSKNYASSSWCLEELAKIMECRRSNEQTAYPVYYDVQPTEVRNQSGVVGEAFAKLVGKEHAWRWRDALKEAGSLAGWDLQTTFDGHEAKFILRIVEDILQDLKFFNTSFDKKLVGMESRVKKVLYLLESRGYGDVCMIGIKGMGGSGKTALAKAVFDHISFQFEGRSFVENVREVSKVSLSGLIELQKRVLSDMLNESIDVTSVTNGKYMLEKVMSSKKVLVVLDDVDAIDQIEALADEPNWFKPGSRIIITTRDEQVLRACHIEITHDVDLLSHEEAICLLSRYAFRRELPFQGYEELSENVVDYAAGLPLTIKVLGTFLSGRAAYEWEKTIERLETIPLKETLEVLERSYNGLEDELQQIFLDVACILTDEKKDEAIRVLESCGFHAEIGLRVLEEKSLITISDDGCLLLHDHIKEMGRNIVRRLHPNEPNKHNRLWNKEEIEDILVNFLGTKATRSIKLLNTHLSPDVILKGLTKLKELRFLYMDNGFKNDIYASPSSYKYANLPNALRYLYWRGCPLSCLPDSFRANNLVNLVMPHSNICQLWKEGEIKVLNKLKFLDLTFSRLRTFDLGSTPHLEMLDLRGCTDFVELHMPATFPMLKYLNLSGSKLNHINIGLTPNLVTLDLSRCNDFVELHMPVACPMLKYLNLSGFNMSNFKLGWTLPLERLESLEELTLSIEDIEHLPDSICMLKHLKSLELISCLLLEQLPKDLGKLQFLEKLYLSDCISLRDIPDNICNLKCLKYLQLSYCILVKQLPEELGRLECLKELNIEGTGVTHLPPSILQLKGLCIVWSKRQLKSYGFKSLTEITRYTASCYV